MPPLLAAFYFLSLLFMAAPSLRLRHRHLIVALHGHQLMQPVAFLAVIVVALVFLGYERLNFCNNLLALRKLLRCAQLVKLTLGRVVNDKIRFMCGIEFLGSSDVGNSDYGREAINTLVKAMEDSRGKLCVIFAGYKNEMEKMLSVNPGMRSRIPFVMDFPDYSRRELQEIAELMLEKQNYRISCEAMTQILDITDIRRKAPNFANAREIRNIIDQTILCQNLRTNGSNREIGLVDVLSYIENEGGYDGFNERTRGYNIR